MVLAFSSPILLVGMRTRDMVGDANFFKEGVELLILTTLICLHGQNFRIKESFHKLLKLMEFSKTSDLNLSK
jgi:hypothetical protein